MEQLTLTTPALLFSAISLIMLAYTNRFLAYAAVVRSLHDKYLQKKDKALIKQIKNLKKLKRLGLNYQKFTSFPIEICYLEKLGELYRISVRSKNRIDDLSSREKQVVQGICG